jgi:hypothetical protein
MDVGAEGKGEREKGKGAKRGSFAVDLSTVATSSPSDSRSKHMRDAFRSVATRASISGYAPRDGERERRVNPSRRGPDDSRSSKRRGRRTDGRTDE